MCAGHRGSASLRRHRNRLRGAGHVDDPRPGVTAPAPSAAPCSSPVPTTIPTARDRPRASAASGLSDPLISVAAGAHRGQLGGVEPGRLDQFERSHPPARKVIEQRRGGVGRVLRDLAGQPAVEVPADGRQPPSPRDSCSGSSSRNHIAFGAVCEASGLQAGPRDQTAGLPRRLGERVGSAAVARRSSQMIPGRSGRSCVVERDHAVDLAGEPEHRRRRWHSTPP